ncbi:MAG: hypothetical protein J3R72DRAFT_442990 [Linnemannia gamsii]|nr:MAG: hypothetical protein J3R72DRAFT_442990 [Linnemannia gamsii]
MQKYLPGLIRLQCFLLLLAIWLSLILLYCTCTNFRKSMLLLPWRTGWVRTSIVYQLWLDLLIDWRVGKGSSSKLSKIC